MSHPFTTGKFFANRKGAYEVIAADTAADSLVIRYIETDRIEKVGLSLQLRIWENMQFEEQEGAKQQAAALEASTKGYGAAFTGLHEADFSATIEGTTWRARDSLAGQVAKLLSHRTSLTFYSKAIYPWNQAYITHLKGLLPHSPQTTEIMSRRTKYRIALDPDCACCGLYTERQGAPAETDDWPGFMNALTKHRALISDNDFLVLAYNDARSEPVVVSDLGEISVFLGSVPAGVNAALFVGACMDRQAALNAGESIALHMANILRTLFPIYAESVQEQF